MILIRRQYILLLGVLLIGAFLRFYNIHDWLIFGMDQEYQALISRNIVTGHNLPLIGVNASDTGLYLGPWFSYAAAVIYGLSAGNPLGGAIVSSLTGLVVITLIYLLGKRFIGERGAVFAALIYASSLLVAFYERQFWNPTPVPLVSLLIGFLLMRLQDGRVKMLPWLFLLLALSFSIHLSLLIFFPLAGYVIWHVRKNISRPLMCYSLVLFFVLIFPQLLFEISHDFLQTGALLSLAFGHQTASVGIPIGQRILLLSDMLGRFIWLSGPVDWFTLSGQCRELSSIHSSFLPGSILMAATCVTLFFRKKSPFVLRYLLAVTALFILLYPRLIFEYYFLFLFPWGALLIGIHLDWLWQKHTLAKIGIVIGLLSFVFLNVRSFTGSSYSYSYRDKINALTFAKEHVANREYGLEAFGECPRFGGWRYLFEYHIGRAPAHSYMDSYFSWLYPQKEFETMPERTVVLSMIDDRMDREIIDGWREKEQQFLLPFTKAAESAFGRIRVYVLEKKDSFTN